MSKVLVMGKSVIVLAFTIAVARALAFKTAAVRCVVAGPTKSFNVTSLKCDDQR